jgi:SAM-dependent methyltransferase
MKFEIRPPYVFYIDHQPRSNVRLSVMDKEPFEFVDGASVFNDAQSQYRWAFKGQFAAGDRLVFTASNCRVEGEVGASGDVPVSDNKVRVYVGAGCDAPNYSSQGWLCNDIAEAAQIYSGITLIGPCWSLSLPDNSVDEIMAKGMIEHLTYHEVARAFAEWKRVLKPGGFFSGEVPDVDEYIREYLKMRTGETETGGEGDSQASRAQGEPDDFAACTGIDRWLRRALYGWQRWPGDEHRSGWTEPMFKFYIDKYFGGRHEIRRMAISFDEDVPGPQRVRHLWARAWK